MAYAKIMNEPLFRSYFNGQYKSIKGKLDKMSDSEYAAIYKVNTGLDLGGSLDKELRYDALRLPKYNMFTLIEGIAGSGKTSAVFVILDKLIESNPNIENKKWFVHGAKETNEEATTTGNGLFGVGKVTSKNKKTFLDSIIKDYTEYEFDDEKKAYIIPSEDTAIDKYGNVVSTKELKETSDNPKVLYIDEITLFNSLEL
jgi:hypothetical protein